jgi:hypothetical protein
MFGLIGGPLILLSGTAVLFGLVDAQSPAVQLAAIPEIIWEGGLTIYLIFIGFRATPLVDLTEAERMSEHARLGEPITVAVP